MLLSNLEKLFSITIVTYRKVQEQNQVRVSEQKQSEVLGVKAATQVKTLPGQAQQMEGRTQGLEDSLKCIRKMETRNN